MCFLSHHFGSTKTFLTILEFPIFVFAYIPFLNIFFQLFEISDSSFSKIPVFCYVCFLNHHFLNFSLQFLNFPFFFFAYVPFLSIYFQLFVFLSHHFLRYLYSAMCFLNHHFLLRFLEPVVVRFSIFHLLFLRRPQKPQYCHQQQ
jgi:hypothetical protein